MIGLPVPVIDVPTAALQWAVGDQINFSGHATDWSGAADPAREPHLDRAVAPLPVGVPHARGPDDVRRRRGPFNAPDHEYPSYMELQLTATDAGGRSASTSVRLDPCTVNLTFQSNPSGLQLTVGSSSEATPFTRNGHRRFGQLGVGDLSPERRDHDLQLRELVGRPRGTHQSPRRPRPRTYTATYTGTGPGAAWTNRGGRRWVDRGDRAVLDEHGGRAARRVRRHDGPRQRRADRYRSAAAGLTWTLVRRTNTQAGVGGKCGRRARRARSPT